MSAWNRPQVPPKRSFHLVFGSHDERAYVASPSRSTSLRATLQLLAVDSLKALDHNRAIKEADISFVWKLCMTAVTGRRSTANAVEMRNY
jgi:hypothetical protein